jgi:hypothetical protein
MNKPRLLDLFCGAGGSARGYQMAGFHVTGVDVKPQPRYCGDEFHQGDALEFCRKHGHEFDAIHASPVCRRFSECTPLASRHKHPNYIPGCQELLMALGLPYVIENVEGAAPLLRTPIMLCGTMFGLKVWKHRYFEIWPEIGCMIPPCAHVGRPVLTAGSGHGRGEASPLEARTALGCEWMGIRQESRDAIPPAYTEFIGKQLMEHLRWSGLQQSELPQDW